MSDRWEEGLIAAAILALRKGNEQPVPRQILDRPSASERLAVQLIRRLTSTVAMAADDTVSASGVEPVSAHPIMRRMLRCSCTAGAVVVRPSDQVGCDAYGAHRHSYCAGYPPDGQWGSVTSAAGARLKMPAGSFGCKMLQLAGSIAHQLQLKRLSA